MNEAPPQPACVLVVDDDEFVRELLRTILTMRGYAVWDAHDGNAAITAVEGGGVDLVLLDFSMSGLSGLETCERLRAGHPDLPVIYLTGGAAELAVSGALPGGADDLVHKPFDEKVLMSRVGRLLERGR